MATSKPPVPATSMHPTTTGSPADIEATAAAVGHGLSRAVAGAQGHLAARAVPSTNLTSELNNIDFRKMIGGPLQAAVDAQVASSLATVNFINNVGFETAEDGKKTLVMVDFSHTRKDVDAEGNEVNKEVAIRVPLLAMLPIPSLRIEHVIIDFKVKLNSVESSKVSDKLGVSVSAGGGFGPVNFKVSASYERQTSTGVEVKKEYALTVNVKAVQDEIPAGLEKILNMLAA
ncbi:DUF2589 domain-containing protein [Sphaerotilus sp.]|uniref:DUF2589 domain-containing protein n=1 Tax=Sphaerotilus sp. TaxID=2093942 RepID=UPI00286D9C90|nr:DUF2589 domain-containing protein [Sphaerotilus sp.]